MMRRLSEVPVYSTRETYVPAANYNHVMLAMLRLSDVIRFPLPGFQYIDVIIDRDSWACVDSSLYDMPMVAWLNFDVKSRDNLFKPIRCTENHYHFMSGMIARNALEHIDDQLLCQLDGLFHEGKVPEKRQIKTRKKHLRVV